MTAKLNRTHLERRAFVYVRQSTAMQVHEHVESKQRQYALVERAATLGWSRGSIEVIDEDQGKSGASRTSGRDPRPRSLATLEIVDRLAASARAVCRRRRSRDRRAGDLRPSR